MSRKGNIGFTLIELLVGIAIIAILAALLMPTINNALDSGQSAKCMSNLKQIGEMVEIYCADSGNMLPPNNSWDYNGSSWLEILVSQVKGISVPNVRDAMARGAVPSHCPVILPSDKDITVKSPSGASYWINYGVNYANLGGLTSWTAQSGWGPPPYISRFKVRNPSKCIYVACGKQALLNYSWASAQPTARHHGRSNVLWLDGHVTSELRSWLIDPANNRARYFENWVPETD